MDDELFSSLSLLFIYIYFIYFFRIYSVACLNGEQLSVRSPPKGLVFTSDVTALLFSL